METRDKIIIEEGDIFVHITLGTRVTVISTTDNYIGYLNMESGKEFIKPRYVFEQMYKKWRE